MQYTGPPVWRNPETTPGSAPLFLPHGPDGASAWSSDGTSGWVVDRPGGWTPPGAVPWGRATYAGMPHRLRAGRPAAPSAPWWTGWPLVMLGVVVAVGSVGPWTALVVPLGRLETTGVAQGGGQFTLALGLAVALAGMAITRRRGDSRVVVLVVACAAVSSLTAAAAIGQVGRRDALVAGVGHYETASGLYLVLVASVLAAVVGLLAAGLLAAGLRRAPAR